MLIPIYLIRACGKSPSATGWLLAPLGVGMILFLSMDRSPDTAVRDTKGIGWRRIFGLRSHAAIYLAGQSRTCTHRASQVPSLCVG